MNSPTYKVTGPSKPSICTLAYKRQYGIPKPYWILSREDNGASRNNPMYYKKQDIIALPNPTEYYHRKTMGPAKPTSCTIAYKRQYSFPKTYLIISLEDNGASHTNPMYSRKHKTV